MQILVTGSLGYDYIMDFPGRFADRIMPEKIHKISLSFLVDKLTKNFGGTAGNIAYSLKLLGLDPLIVSPAGKDFDPYAVFLKKHNIDIKGIKIFLKEMTGSYFVVTDREDNQIGSFYSGATKFAKELHIFRQGDDSRTFAVLAPTEPEAMKKYVRECRENNIPYLYDPAFQIDSFTRGELRQGIEGSEIFIGNDYEISLVEQKLGIHHENLRNMVPILVTTLGSKGSVIETGKEKIIVKPAKPKKVVDPTGAGDAYRAGFLSGYVRFVSSRLSLKAASRLSLVKTEELTICGQMGSVAAVYTVETYGTVTHHYTYDQFKKRYNENYGTNLL